MPPEELVPGAPLQITHLLPDGRGCGFDGARRVLVAGALPGDQITYRPRTTRKRVIDAELVSVVQPSPARRAPRCSWADRCGGCDLAALSDEARVQALRRTAQGAIRRIPGAEALSLEWIPSPQPTGHRARIKLAIEGGQVGYRAPRSHQLVPIDGCPIARPEVEAALGRLRQIRLPEGLDSVEIRSDGARAIYAFQGSPDDLRPLKALGDVALNGKVLVGSPRLSLEVLGVSLRASPRSFYQVNLQINALLVEHVRDQVRQAQAERVLDLYAGIGNLSLPIADLQIPVTAVELEGQAIGDLRAKIGERPVEAVSGKVERFDPSHTAFDVAILDPPRSGAPGVIRRLIRQRPRRLIYVSCHLPSAAADLREAEGYRLVSARLFDMFPQTHHFETVLVLQRA